MRALAILSTLVTTLSTLATAQGSLTASPPPTFEALFVGTLIIGDIEMINGATFGTRVRGAVTGGNLTDTTGTVVAQILPTADTGVLSDSNIFFPKLVLPLIWTVDSKYAHLSVQGVGRFTVEDMVYIHLETDSEEYSSLNSRFLVGNISFPGTEPNNPSLTIFGVL